MADDDESWIPCELCETSVRWGEYNTHLQMCTLFSGANELVIPFSQIAMMMQRIMLADSNAGDGDVTNVASQPIIRYQVMMFANDGETVTDTNEFEINTQIAEQVGNVEIGVDNIDDVIQDTVIEETQSDVDALCVVCQEYLSKCKHIVQTKVCKHLFCKSCISEWFKKSKKCPVCLTEVENTSSSV